MRAARGVARNPLLLRLRTVLVIVVVVAGLTVSLSTRAHAASWWVPPLGSQPWQWELDHQLRLTSATDMGTHDRLPDGAHAPAPVIYDIDGNYYSAQSEGIPTTYFAQLRDAGEFGNRVEGYPEYYLNITSKTTVSIVEAMIRQQCSAKGFDAVETDIDTEYADDSGFALTRMDEVRYMTTVATYIHGLGMGWWIKNPDDTGDGFAADMYPLADAVLTEQCNQYDSCGLLRPYFGHKAVFNAEYSLAPSRFCARDDALGINGAQFSVALTGVRRPCR